jgi:hypothetical protein
MEKLTWNTQIDKNRHEDTKTINMGLSGEKSEIEET